LLKNTSWEEIELQSGVERAKIRSLGEVYRQARSTVISWCLGVTQHEHAVDTIQEIINVLLMRGNIGREGSGPCPIRGRTRSGWLAWTRHVASSRRGSMGWTPFA